MNLFVGLTLANQPPNPSVCPSRHNQPRVAKPYDFEDPAFYDISSFPWAAELEAQTPVILAELEAFLRDPPAAFQPYFRPDLVNRAGVWQTLGMMTWGMENRALIQHFPKTLAALRRIPNVVGLSFNQLEPHGQVKYHQGNTNGIARFHLGLKVPAKNELAFFRVSGEDRPWQFGRLLAFTDAHWHTALNNSEESRYIMLFDVVLDKYARQRDYLCGRVAADLCVQYVVGKSPRLSALKGWRRAFVRWWLYFFFVPYFHVMVKFNPDILGWFD